MSERDGYEPGVPCWIDTLQPDPEAAMRFTVRSWAGSSKGRAAIPGDSGSEYWVARLRGCDVAGIGSQPAQGGSASTAWSTYVFSDSVVRTAGLARDAGGTVIVEALDVSPAGRLAIIADPSGAPLGIWEPGDRQGAQLVNEPGAWAMSQLNTRDPEGAATFYGEVFGWTTETFEMGEDAITMLKVPGYVGGEPEQPVARDVVATMVSMGEQFPEEVGPHWSVNFWVDDTDAIAERAAELGGGVTAGPFDTPISRDAVISDPQGAVLSVSTITAGG